MLNRGQILHRTCLWKTGFFVPASAFHDPDIRLDLRLADPDGRKLVLPDHHVHHAAFAYADVGCSFRGNRRDGIQYFQRRTAEGAVDRR